MRVVPNHYYTVARFEAGRRSASSPSRPDLRLQSPRDDKARGRDGPQLAAMTPVFAQHRVRDRSASGLLADSASAREGYGRRGA